MKHRKYHFELQDADGKTIFKFDYLKDAEKMFTTLTNNGWILSAPRPLRLIQVLQAESSSRFNDFGKLW